MNTASTEFVGVRRSLADITDPAGVDQACAARAAFGFEDLSELQALAHDPVEFLPEEDRDRHARLLSKVGERIVDTNPPFSPKGAGTKGFAAATHTGMAPLSAWGPFRIGEDGKLYLITKSEHYHAPLGHGFAGYRLVDIARKIGMVNATHNNTRGWITRLLEERLVAEANGLDWGDRAALDRILGSQDAHILNRVLNLETGSLAAEAALKMILARFYLPQEGCEKPRYAGRIPVILVVGNDDGGLHANYHGTTFLTQTMRGMWREFAGAMERADLFRVHAVRPNRDEDLDAAFEQFDQGRFKIAGFFHEIVMMNYGARLLTPAFLRKAHDLCREHDVPTVVDEIQSCVWAPKTFLFKEYGLAPSFVALGKGFSGGEYPASRILFSAAFDNLPQFGALVTNGQEELASLSYLITLEWTRANSEVTRRIGDDYESRLRAFADRHSDSIAGVEGNRHLSALRFRDLPTAKAFVARLTVRGLDLSVQTYKADAPPVVLTKIPLISDAATAEAILKRMEEAMS